MNRPENTLPIKILIAEDDSINQRLMAIYLKSWENNLVFADNGMEALRLFRKFMNQIRLVFMDVRMPLMNGVEATQRILELNPKARVIALSAFAKEENSFGSDDAGFVDYLNKPIRKDELVNIVNKYIE